MSTTYVLAKDGAASITAPIQLALGTTETLTSVTVGAPTPVDAGGIALTILSASGVNPLSVSVTGGVVGVTYGFPLLVTTSLRVLSIVVAVSCASQAFDPYLNKDPGAYQPLVGSIAAGKSALATSIFNFDPSVDPSAGYVLWDILGADGTVYSSGNAYDYSISSSAFASTVTAHSVVSVPSNIPPALDTPYQLRYTLTIPSINGVAYNYESLQVYGMPDVQLGTQDALELQGDLVTLSLVTEQVYANYVLEIYDDSGMLASMVIANPDRIANGYFVAGSFDTTPLSASLLPYKVMWKFWNNPNQVFRESASLWIVNPSIVGAIEDVKSKINKARQTLYGTPDSQFPSTEIMKWLRRGGDAFNGYPPFTSFDMTNAMGVVREFWLMYAEKAALESQAILEAEKAFNFTGAAISLDVDKTAALESAVSRLQGILDNEMKNIKVNLTIKGITSGTGAGPQGNGNFNVANRSALGGVLIAITPASIYNNGVFYGGSMRP